MEFSELFKNQQLVYRWTNGALEIDEARKELAVLSENGCARVEDVHPATKLSKGMNFRIENKILC